jgi:hypothetical protein
LRSALVPSEAELGIHISFSVVGGVAEFFDIREDLRRIESLRRE